MFKLKKLFIFILFNILYSEDFLPSDNSTANYTHIFFNWPQIIDADSYLLSIISNDESYEIVVDKNAIILEEFLEWSKSYNWIVCGRDINQNLIDCHQEKSFTISALPGYFPNQSSVVVNSDEYYNGLTFLDFDSKNFSAAIDKDGEPVWYVDKNLFGSFNPRIVLTQVLQNGNFIGYGVGKGYEFDMDGNIIFQTPDDLGVHHHIIKTSNDTYFIIKSEFEDHPCPGDCPENLPEIISWQGDRFIEINENQEIVWDWNTFNYFSLDEYNPFYVERLSNSYPNQEHFDWTHANSIFFDLENNYIYVSVRNLSRIVKIDYESSLIDWQLGNIDYMDTIFFNESINFSQQHSVQLIDNGNLLFFDNHSYLIPEVSRCIEFNIDQDTNEPNIVWEFDLPDSIFTGSRGECDRLNNGNTLISAGRTGKIFEVDNLGDIKWQYHAQHNNQDVTIFRSERLPSLYAQAYSIIIDGLSGSYVDGYTFENVDSLKFTIHNLGYYYQLYRYELYSNDNIVVDDIIEVNAYSFENISINFSDIYFESNNCSLRVYPVNNEFFVQNIDFIFTSTLGDINYDGIVNVQDAIILVSSILLSENNNEYDFNNDSIVNIIDIIILINLILDYE